MTDLHTRLRAAICCPSGVCCSPGDCYATDCSRSQLVDIDQAARAVATLLREEWRKQAGPYSRTTHLPGFLGAAACGMQERGEAVPGGQKIGMVGNGGNEPRD